MKQGMAWTSCEKGGCSTASEDRFCTQHHDNIDLRSLIPQMKEWWVRFDEEVDVAESPHVFMVESAGVFRFDGEAVGITLVLEDGTYAMATYDQLKKAMDRYVI